MEQKHFIMSALGVGIGVGVGLGLASGQAVSKWKGSTPTTAVSAERMEQEMLHMVIDGREAKITFDEFPYYLRYRYCPFKIFQNYILYIIPCLIF